MSTTNHGDHPSNGLRWHSLYADYFYGTASDLDAHDGFRLIAGERGRRVEFDHAVSLVATNVSYLPGPEGLLIAVEFVDRASHVSDVVDETLYGLPAASAPTVAVAVFDADEQVLIRG